MENLAIGRCPKCGIVFRFPADKGAIKLICPICKTLLLYDDGSLTLYSDGIPISVEKGKNQGSRFKLDKHKKTLFSISAIIVSFLLLCVIFLFANRHKHTWIEANCTQPRTCLTCGITEGTALGHSWNEATCTKPKTCSVCGEEEGSANGHTWTDATCTEPRRCTICGTIDGVALGHTFTNNSFSTPGKCIRCSMMGRAELPPSGHVFIDVGLNKDSELTIKTSDSKCYVKLKSVDDDTTVFSFFVRDNSTTTVEVPSGQYYIYFASGNIWYGTKQYFGLTTSYSKDDEVLDFYNYTYTFTLYNVANGNFEETPISKAEFD